MSKSMIREPYLTKSRYLQGLACPKMLWLGWHDPVPYKEPEAGSPQQVGIKIGENAHSLFPGGVLVDEAPWEHDQAVKRTSALMADPNVPAIFEATYEYNDIRIRVDIMERLGENVWGVREVKGSSGVKSAYIYDVAVQLYVLRGLSIEVTSVELVHINKTYVRDRDSIDWPIFFKRADLTQDANDACRDVAARTRHFFSVLNRTEKPDIEAGKHCPNNCDFLNQCTKDKPEDWILKLPRLTAKKFEELRSQGIEAIRDIPEEISLTATQEAVRRVWRNDAPYISADLPKALKAFGPPVYYLDFETMSPTIPLYPQTRPFQRIPFQWSLHHMDSAGKISHQEFLAQGNMNPSHEFAISLIDAVGNSDESIAVYSSFEKGVLREIVKQFPLLSDRVNQIITRLNDLLPVVRGNTYFREYGGSFSIKSVAPVFTSQVNYKDLEHVADGMAASATFERIVSSSLSPSEDETALRVSLLEYCKLDTLAMVEVHKALMGLE